MKPGGLKYCLSLLITCATIQAGMAASAVEPLLNQAQAAALKGQRAEAWKLANQAVAAEPNNPQCYYVRGRIFASAREHAKAIEDFDQLLKLEPRAAEVYQLRGYEHFKLGRFNEAIADFDKAIDFVPKQEPHHWQRGIAYYYAGRYEDGRKQFELHQTVNSNDVENAVWHFICISRSQGAEKARAALLPIKDDARIPMMKVYELFAGKAKPAEVLAVAGANYSSTSQLKQQLFFAHLYLGLYYEAHGNAQLAREHINKAAGEFAQDHYMGDVARVHAAVLRKN